MGKDEPVLLPPGLLDKLPVQGYAADGTITYWNRASQQLYGHAPDEVLGRNLVGILVPPERGAAELAAIGQALDSGQPDGPVERLLLRKDGGMVPVLRSQIIPRVAGPAGELFCIDIDLSGLKQADSERQLRTTFLEAVANSSADGILVVDLMGRKILQNQRTLDLWKIPREVAEDPDGMRQVRHIMGMTRNPRQFLDEINHQKQFPLDITKDELELVDGTVLDRYSAPVLGDDGRNYGRVYTFHDVTGFRQAEARIKGLLAEKEILLREVHHRIKNNMATLMGLLTLQAASLTNQAAIQALEDAQGRIQSMMLLYQKLYESPESVGMPVGDYLPQLVREIIANFPLGSAVRVDTDIQDFFLEAKKIQVLGIITNELVTNIMKYAFVGRDSGVIRVAASLSGQRVSLSIQDNGASMPESVGFDETTGFGLMLVKMLVDQLSGTIGIDRREGTRIFLEFPI